jgi:hypothetical protein
MLIRDHAVSRSLSRYFQNPSYPAGQASRLGRLPGTHFPEQIMAYSCTDFFDDVMRALVEAQAISSADIPNNNPGEGADIAIAAIVSISRAALSARFITELLHEVGSLGAVSEQFGAGGLAFLFHLQAAVLNDTSVQRLGGGDIRVVKLIERLPSALTWMKHIQVETTGA